MKRYEKLTKKQLLFLIENTPNRKLKLYLIRLLALKSMNIID
jgi:hypothetical protein